MKSQINGGETYINNGLSTDLMCVNDARLTSSRSTDSAKTGGDEAVDSSVDVIGDNACSFYRKKYSMIRLERRNQMI